MALTRSSAPSSLGLRVDTKGNHGPNEFFWGMARGFASIGLLFTCLVMTAGPAEAQPSSSCDSRAYNVQGSEKSPGVYQTMNGIRGYNQTGDAYYCVRVGSFGILGPDDSPSDRQYVEIGWLLGYDCNTFSAYWTVPEHFLTYNRGNGGGYHCVEYTKVLDPDSAYYLRVSNGSGTDWHYFLSGNEWFNVDLDFSNGIGYTNGERHNTGDTARAHFFQMQESHSVWSDMDNLSLLGDSDPGFHFESVGPNDNRVSPD